MSTSRPNKTIDQLFDEFLADQEARLSPKAFDKPDRIIHLDRSSALSCPTRRSRLDENGPVSRGTLELLIVNRNQGQMRLPESLRQFVERQTSMPVTDLWRVAPKEVRSPYGTYWYRAVACLLLSGRVQAKFDGTPNMTDVNRVGKEANFNQYLTQRVGTLLVAMGAIQPDRQDRFVAGPNLDTSGTKMSQACGRSRGRPFHAWSGRRPATRYHIRSSPRMGA